MRRLAIALVFAGTLAAAGIEAKSNYALCHWNEGTNSYSFVKTDYSGYTTHILSGKHPNDSLSLYLCTEQAH